MVLVEYCLMVAILARGGLNLQSVHKITSPSEESTFAPLTISRMIRCFCFLLKIGGIIYYIGCGFWGSLFRRSLTLFMKETPNQFIAVL
jgi:hypothetical protein